MLLSVMYFSCPDVGMNEYIDRYIILLHVFFCIFISSATIFESSLVLLYRTPKSILFIKLSNIHWLFIDMSKQFDILNKMVVELFIPARFASKRLPGKPLADIGGRPMIQWVYERASRGYSRR